MKANGAKLTIVGNWHNRASYSGHAGGRIEQVGALTPTGFDNTGHDYGHIVHVSADLKISRSVVSGVRFHSFQWPPPKDLDLNKDAFLHVEARRADMVPAREWLRSQDIGGFELFPSKAEASQIARDAGESASKATSVRDAFETYVENMAVPDGVDKGSVLRRLRGYTKSALGA
jgi:hypothetical protein